MFWANFTLQLSDCFGLSAATAENEQCVWFKLVCFRNQLSSSNWHPNIGYLILVGLYCRTIQIHIFLGSVF